MKKSYYQLVYLVLILFVFIVLPDIIHAQGGPGGPGNLDGIPDPDCPPDVICPIDGGLTALIAVGVGYGIKKWRDQRKTESIS